MMMEVGRVCGREGNEPKGKRDMTWEGKEEENVVWESTWDVWVVAERGERKRE